MSVHIADDLGVMGELPLRIIKQRGRYNWTATDLARAAKIKPSVVWNLEGGYALPTVKTIVRIARALNVSLDYLCGFRAEPEPLDPSKVAK